VVQGREDVIRFLAQRVFSVRGPIVIEPLAANRQPAAALYERGADGERGLSIHVLTFADGLVTRIAGFVGDELFPAFGLPRLTRSNTRDDASVEFSSVGRPSLTSLPPHAPAGGYLEGGVARSHRPPMTFSLRGSHTG